MRGRAIVPWAGSGRDVEPLRRGGVRVCAMQQQAGTAGVRRKPRPCRSTNFGSYAHQPHSIGYVFRSELFRCVVFRQYHVRLFGDNNLLWRHILPVAAAKCPVCVLISSASNALSHEMKDSVCINDAICGPSGDVCPHRASACGLALTMGTCIVASAASGGGSRILGA